MAQLRKARVRAVALAAVPFVLFLVALAPRVWQPDLVPFGDGQAAYVLNARSRLPVSWAAPYGDLSLPTLALFEPWLRVLPTPIVAWVVLRGLLDALGAALLYLAARPVVGVAGGIVAALLYAVSPTAWAAARDPAGPLGALVAAAALLGAVRLLERPTLLRGAAFGVLLGLLARSVPAGLVVVPLGAATLAAARASWRTGGVTALGLVLAAGPALFAQLQVLRYGRLSMLEPLWIAGHATQFTAYPLFMLFDPLVNPFNTRLYELGISIPSAAHLVVNWIVTIVQRVLDPTLPLVVASVVVAIMQARRGRRGTLLAAIWGSIWLLSMTWVQLGATAYSRLTTGEPQVFNWHIPLVVLPPQALLLAIAMTARQPVVRWYGRVGMAYLLVAAAVTMAMTARLDLKQDRTPNVFAHRDLDGVIVDGPVSPFYSTLALVPSLRDVTALADAIEEATGRAAADNVIVLDALTGQRWPRHLEAVVGDGITIRTPLYAAMLPLERDLVFVSTAGDGLTALPLPAEFQRPSSAVAVFTSTGTDTGARLLTLRPRTLEDWLARVQTFPDGRFVNGATLLGARRDAWTASRVDFSLYWQVTAMPESASAPETLPFGPSVRVALTSAQAPVPNVPPRPSSVRETLSTQSPLPVPSLLRSGEIIVQSFSFRIAAQAEGAGPLSVMVLDRQGLPIPTVAGPAELTVPLGVPQP
ncbi:MAG: hypothetical protein U0893_01520 [Chloroflexota bacterium]